MSEEVFILTGPVQSGKTSRLFSWSRLKNNVYGIATPVLDGHRFFFDLHEKILFPMEAKPDEKDILKVGKYNFSRAAFQRAEKIIEKAMKEEGYIVIDEIGPLELNGEGFCRILRKIISFEKRKFKPIIVVRESLLQEVEAHFLIKKYNKWEI